MNEIPIMTQAQRIMYRDPVLVVLAAIECQNKPHQPPLNWATTESSPQQAVSA